MSPSSSYLLREPSQSYILYACRHCRPLTGDANNDIDYGLPELVGWMCAMTSPRYTFSSWWSPNQETSRQDLLSLTSLGISFPEKHISHKSDEQYFLNQYFCISSTCIWKKVKVSSSATCIIYKFDHPVAPLVSVIDLAPRWGHWDQLKIWQTVGATSIT